MIRARWKATLCAVLLSGGIAAAQSSGQAGRPAEPAEKLVTVQQGQGAPESCRLLKTWTTGDGRRAWLLRSVENETMLTVVEASHGPADAALVGISIYRWSDPNLPPKGSPLPPSDDVRPVAAALPAPEPRPMPALESRPLPPPVPQPMKDWTPPPAADAVRPVVHTTPAPEPRPLSTPAPQPTMVSPPAPLNDNVRPVAHTAPTPEPQPLPAPETHPMSAPAIDSAADSLVPPTLCNLVNHLKSLALLHYRPAYAPRLCFPDRALLFGYHQTQWRPSPLVEQAPPKRRPQEAHAEDLELLPPPMVSPQ
jgi:hypothetical protein